MRWTLLVVALAGCHSNSGAKLNESCSKDTPCGDGTTCDFTAPDGPTCISADDDLDGDGIPNGQDHCPRVAGGAFDEDGDGIGDDCDKCPISPPPSSADADADEVDAPCDPDDHEKGDQIAIFEGFNGDIPSNWTPSDPNAFQIDNGELVVNPPSEAGATIQIPIPRQSTNMAVIAGYKLVSLQNTNTHRIAITGDDVRPAGGEHISCGPQRVGLDDTLLVESAKAGSQTGVVMLDTFSTSDNYKITFRQAGAAVDCVIVDNAMSGVVSTSSSGDSMPTAGILVQGATVRFQYILVVTRTGVQTILPQQ